MDRITALQAFVRLVELGTFSAVAEDLRVKQSTVSKWIAALERELGGRLVTRTTRTVRVTEAGQRFYAGAKDILQAYQAATDEFAEGSVELQGRLRIGLPVVFGTMYVVPWLTDFVREHPRLDVEASFDDRYVSLVDDDLDVVVRVGVPVDSTLRARTLARSERRVVAAPGYLARAGRPETPRDLARHPRLLHSRALSGVPWVFTRNGRAHRVAGRGAFYANHSQALLAAAEAGLGVALLADWLVDEAVAAGRLASLLPEYAAPPAPIQALTAPGGPPPLRVRAFVDGLTDVLRARLGAASFKPGRGVGGVRLR